MKKKLSVTLAALLAGSTMTAALPAVITNAATAPDTCLIRSVKTGAYLSASSDRDGDNAVILDADGIDLYNVWTREETSDGQVVFHANFSYNSVLTVNSEGTLTVSTREDGNAFQQFGQEGTGDSCKFTAGGWELSADDDGTIHMQEGSDASLWELIPVQYNETMPGDVNQDGEVDIFDLDASMRLLVSGDKTQIERRAIADVTRDGTFDVADLIRLTKYLHGITPIITAQDATVGNTRIRFPQNTMRGEIVPPTDEPTDDTTEPATEPDTEPTEQPTEQPTEPPTEQPTEVPVDTLTLADMPASYKEPMEWIWENRFVREGSTSRQNTIFDQIVAGEGTLNFVVRWQSYKTITYEQRQQFEEMAEKTVNSWTDYLRGYDGWPYDHVDVKIVGWAVLDKSCLLDLHDDEIVYDSLISDYDASGDTSNGRETIPDKLPSAPSELSRFDHFTDKSYQYPGGLDKRFDMYLWCTQGFPDIGGCGGDWGQRLSDNAYLAMLDGSNLHVLIHEVGHGFGITDFYGGEGALDGFPPGGFPDGGTSIMMAGSSAQITEFDGWMLRYIWSQIKDEEGRF